MTVSITKAEREDLQRLVRQREKVLKSHAQLRSKELLADFENQMAAQYAFDDDAVWEAAAKEAEAEIRKARRDPVGRRNRGNKQKPRHRILVRPVAGQQRKAVSRCIKYPNCAKSANRSGRRA